MAASARLHVVDGNAVPTRQPTRRGYVKLTQIFRPHDLRTIWLNRARVEMAAAAPRKTGTQIWLVGRRDEPFQVTRARQHRDAPAGGGVNRAERGLELAAPRA